MRTDTKDSYLESINRVVAYMEQNSTSDLQLKDIALQANLSQYHFHRVFKSLTGETTKDFLTRLRLEKAALKIQYSKADIGKIAFDCGYQDHETFTRAFKNYFGITPLDYRKSASEIIMNKQQAFIESNIDLDSLKVQGPVIKTIPDLHLAYIRHNGSYDKVGSSFKRLVFWAATHLALKLKPVTIGIVHDNPDLTAESNIRFDACVLLSRKINPGGEVGYKQIEGGKFAVFTYDGPYEGFYTVYDYIYNVCLFENKFDLADKPALEWYVRAPPFYKPENYSTDFYVPIK